MEEYSDSEDDMDSDQGFLPSSLNDLLTTGERQRRQSRQDDVLFEPRFQHMAMMPSPLSGSMSDEKSEGLGFSFELTRSASLATGMDNLAMMIPGHFPPPMFAHHDQLNVFGEHGSSPPAGNNYNRHGSSVGGHNSQAHYKERSGTPDPFCPFPQEAEEVQFKMDDDVVGPLDTQRNRNASRAFGSMDHGASRQRAGLFEQGSTPVVVGGEQQDKGVEALTMAFSGGMFMSPS
ncbi:hypothetical protein BGZ59_002942 [Podila verticillata]|nr:hypothetical protein BGZ59_002942 [Podila verticillata]